MVFARLKELGFTSEFVTEQARLYISNIRFMSKIHGHLDLSDEDQLAIMAKQYKAEEVMAYSLNGVGDIICDSSPLNALFYMSSDFREDSKTKLLISKTLASTEYVFYCEPILESSVMDPNRLHTQEQSLVIDKSIFSVLKTYAPDLIPNIKILKGSPEERASKVVNFILDKKCWR